MYQITQTLDSWCMRKPEITVIREFKYFLTAWIYKFFHYDFAEPVWKGTCDWKIEKKRTERGE